MKTINQAEAEGWSEKVRRRTERIFGLVLIILLAAILLVSATLFLTTRSPLPYRRLIPKNQATLKRNRHRHP